MQSIFYENFNTSLANNSGETILETSLREGLAHAHACGGNALCSSCRICIVDGLENLEKRNTKEAELALKIGFPSDMRLGCQTRILDGKDIKIKLPILDDIDMEIASSQSSGNKLHPIGTQKELSFVFADMEGFTPFTESSPPYDVVHILNRYYYLMDKLISQHNGFIVDFFGDGLFAAFGLNSPESHAIDAVNAGRAINDQMTVLNEYAKSLVNKEFKLRVGIHSDKVIVATVGMNGKEKLSVIGDGVNFASRIENANKDLGTYFLISEKTYNLTKEHLEIKGAYDIEAKGKKGCYKVFEVAN